MRRSEVQYRCCLDKWSSRRGFVVRGKAAPEDFQPLCLPSAKKDEVRAPIMVHLVVKKR